MNKWISTLALLILLLIPLLASAATIVLPQTGQTTSYAAGDDGDWKTGVAWPMPRFTDNGDGTVTDHLTDLIWLQNANCFGGISIWTNAVSSANALASGSCGLTDGSNGADWHLPTVNELGSLVDVGQFNPALPSGHPFTGVQLDCYWSSTLHAMAFITYNPFHVNMVDGSIFTSKDLVDSCYVWPVRGGP